MVVIGWVFMFNLCVLLCDEISFGFVLVVVKDIYVVFLRICVMGVLIVIIEQDIGQVLKVVDWFYCMMEGCVMLFGILGVVSCEEIYVVYFGVYIL